MFVKKLYIGAIIILIMVGLAYIVTPQYKINRVMTWLGLETEQTQELKSKNLNTKTQIVDNKIINQIDGIVIALDKDKVYIKSEKENVTAIYDNFKVINPLVVVGKEVSKGFTLGRKKLSK